MFIIRRNSDLKYLARDKYFAEWTEKLQMARTFTRIEHAKQSKAFNFIELVPGGKYGRTRWSKHTPEELDMTIIEVNLVPASSTDGSQPSEG